MDMKVDSSIKPTAASFVVFVEDVYDINPETP
jgi:hypothetical protein